MDFCYFYVIIEHASAKMPSWTHSLSGMRLAGSWRLPSQANSNKQGYTIVSMKTEVNQGLQKIKQPGSNVCVLFRKTIKFLFTVDIYLSKKLAVKELLAFSLNDTK